MWQGAIVKVCRKAMHSSPATVFRHSWYHQTWSCPDLIPARHDPSQIWSPTLLPMEQEELVSTPWCETPWPHMKPSIKGTPTKGPNHQTLTCTSQPTSAGQGTSTDKCCFIQLWLFIPSSACRKGQPSQQTSSFHLLFSFSHLLILRKWISSLLQMRIYV